MENVEKNVLENLCCESTVCNFFFELVCGGEVDTLINEGHVNT